jgi:hypothetical protein
MGSKDFAGAQAISQAYGRALENTGYGITFKDDLDGYAREARSGLIRFERG